MAGQLNEPPVDRPGAALEPDGAVVEVPLGVAHGEFRSRKLLVLPGASGWAELLREGLEGAALGLDAPRSHLDGFHDAFDGRHLDPPADPGWDARARDRYVVLVGAPGLVVHQAGIEAVSGRERAAS